MKNTFKIICCALVILLQAANSTDKPVKAPEKKLESLKGEEISLQEFRGKIILLTFFKRSCPPCEKEVPVLNKLSQKNPKFLEVIGVGYKIHDSDQVSKLAKKWGMKYTVLADPQGRMARDLKIFSCPYSLLIDEYGFIIWRSMGYHPEALEKGVLAEVERLKNKNRPPHLCCLPLYNATSAARKKGLGKEVSRVLSQGLSKRGLKVVKTEASSDIILDGSVSKIGRVTGISVNVKNARNGALLDNTSITLQGNNYDRLIEKVYEKISVLP